MEFGVWNLEFCQRSFFVPGKCHQSFSKFGQFIPANGCLAFFSSQMRPRQQLAKVLVSAPRFDQYRKDRLILHGQFGAYNALGKSGTSRRRRFAHPIPDATSGHYPTSCPNKKMVHAGPQSLRYTPRCELKPDAVREIRFAPVKAAEIAAIANHAARAQ